jgi:hypothetical protein
MKRKDRKESFDEIGLSKFPSDARHVGYDLFGYFCLVELMTPPRSDRGFRRLRMMYYFEVIQLGIFLRARESYARLPFDCKNRFAL